MENLSIIGRKKLLFSSDVDGLEEELCSRINGAKFLVIGGAGSIGKSVVKEIFSRSPKALHVIDISENNLVELVRDLRSSQGYIDGDFRTFCMDAGGKEMTAFLNTFKNYDYVVNLSALKHVRSEKDPFSLMRMLKVNILDTLSLLQHSDRISAKSYFCVSTDKAANPVNLMGASKSIMELCLQHMESKTPVTSARFANVAFSDGSLLHGFNQRFLNLQPLSAPVDVKRYFVLPKEAGQLCLLAILKGQNNDIFFPKYSNDLPLTSFSEIAINYIKSKGFDPYECGSEQEARERADELIKNNFWPTYFFKTDTTGEKPQEEFYTDNEQIVTDEYQSIGIIRRDNKKSDTDVNEFIHRLENLRVSGVYNKNTLVELMLSVLPEMKYIDLGRYLDDKM